MVLHMCIIFGDVNTTFSTFCFLSKYIQTYSLSIYVCMSNPELELELACCKQIEVWKRAVDLVIVLYLASCTLHSLDTAISLAMYSSLSMYVCMSNLEVEIAIFKQIKIRKQSVDLINCVF